MARSPLRWQTTFLPLVLSALILPNTASPAEPATTYTQDPIFYIPFHVDQLDPQFAEQVQLFVSGDQSRSWQLYQTKQLSEERFLFRAGVDGEFWFAIKSGEPGDTGSNANEVQPELIVVLDRAAPAVEFTAEPSPQRDISLQYTIEEAHLAKQGVQIEYRSGDDALWTMVPTSPSLQASGATQWQGTAHWLAVGQQAAHTVRLTVTDRAGNTTVVERSVDLTAALPLVASEPPIAAGSKMFPPDPPSDGGSPMAPLPAINPPTARQNTSTPSAQGWQPSNASFRTTAARSTEQ